MTPSMKADVIGCPVDHSLSPLIHQLVYDDNGLPWVYGRMSCSSEDEVRAHVRHAYARASSWLGFNVTMPYKRTVMDLADRLDASALMVGGANVLCFEGDGSDTCRIVGYNTDGFGVVSTLEKDAGRTLQGARVAVCGTGATALSALVSCLLAGAEEVLLASRTPDAASRLLSERLESVDHAASHADGMVPTGFGPARRLVVWDDKRRRVRAISYEKLASAMPMLDVIVDATPLGMKPGDRCVVDSDLIAAHHTVLDVVYGHGETAIARACREHGARFLDGRGMLVDQAIATMRIFADAQGVVLSIDRAAILHALDSAG